MFFKLFQWIKRASVSKESSSVHPLFFYLEKEFQKQFSELSSIDTFQPEARVELYLLLEKKILKEKKALTVKQLRKMVKDHFPELQDDPYFFILFLPNDLQEFHLSKRFIEIILNRAMDFYGKFAENTFAKSNSWLANLSDIPHNEPDASIETFQYVTKEIYQMLSDTIGESSVIQIYEYSYKTLYDCYHLLNTFSVIINYLPEQTLDREKISLLSLKQTKAFLFEKINKLHEVNDELETKNNSLRTIQKELIDARNDDERANKMKSQFLANMSHELRTPMTAILGFAELMTFNTQLDDKTKHFAECIKENAERLTSLINNFLDISKIEAGKYHVEYKTFHLNELEVVKNSVLPLLAKKDLDFQIIFKVDKNTTVRTDKNKLIQILVNLISNAVKFTEKGYVHLILGIDENACLNCEIHDSGRGISEEDKTYIFQEFYQVHADENKQLGTGLGLAITKRLVDLLNGEIQLHSKENQGTSFFIKLPLIQKKVTIENETRSDLLALKEQLKTYVGDHSYILIAEDNINTQDVYKELFTGIPIKIANNGSEVLDILSEHLPIFIFLDIMMPKMDGIETIRELRKNPKTKHLSIFAVTAKVFENETKEIMAEGFDGIIAKPIEFTEMLSKPLELLAKNESN